MCPPPLHRNERTDFLSSLESIHLRQYYRLLRTLLRWRPSADRITSEQYVLNVLIKWNFDISNSTEQSQRLFELINQLPIAVKIKVEDIYPTINRSANREFWSACYAYYKSQVLPEMTSLSSPSTTTTVVEANEDDNESVGIVGRELLSTLVRSELDDEEHYTHCTCGSIICYCAECHPHSIRRKGMVLFSILFGLAVVVIIYLWCASSSSLVPYTEVTRSPAVLRYPPVHVTLSVLHTNTNIVTSCTCTSLKQCCSIIHNGTLDCIVSPSELILGSGDVYTIRLTSHMDDNTWCTEIGFMDPSWPGSYITRSNRAVQCAGTERTLFIEGSIFESDPGPPHYEYRVKAEPLSISGVRSNWMVTHINTRYLDPYFVVYRTRLTSSSSNYLWVFVPVLAVALHTLLFTKMNRKWVLRCGHRPSTTMAASATPASYQMYDTSHKWD